MGWLRRMGDFRRRGSSIRAVASCVMPRDSSVSSGKWLVVAIGYLHAIASTPAGAQPGG